MLYVEDDGPGFDFASAVKRSSGLGLVQALSSQLKGHVEVARSDCTRCIVRFAEGRDVEA
jgi:two-component sensor histidine kinase